MKSIFKIAALSTVALLGISTHVNALTPHSEIEGFVQEAALSLLSAPIAYAPKLNTKATIGIARIDKGRLISAPFREMQDWAFLDKRTHMNFSVISPAAHIKNIPEVAFDGHGSVNQIDEIRMTASDLRMDYMIVYGLGDDAQWGSIGGKSMMDTGLVASNGSISPRGDAKALLINTYTGEVYGTVTSDLAEFGVGDLTDRVQDLVNNLTQEKTVTRA